MRILTFFITLLVTAACFTRPVERTATTEVHPGNNALVYNGRVQNDTDSVAIYWPGTSLTFRFEGTGVTALLKDESGSNYFNVIIDNDSLRYFRLDKFKTRHALAEGLENGPHTIQLIKRTESDKGATWLYGLSIVGKLLPPPPPRDRIIEFFGNSITAGYAIEDNSGGDSPDSIYTNNYATYAAITARYFNADYYCTARSGIGILVSWFPQTMPEIYDRLDPNDPASKWDFSRVKPDVVVINLFQNDSWLTKMPDHESFKMRFGLKPPDESQIVDAYRAFVANIRKVYPDAYIICALGSMDAVKKDSPWPGYIVTAVKQLQDEKILTHFFPFMGKGGHPRKKDNKAMAQSLIDFIEKNVTW